MPRKTVLQLGKGGRLARLRRARRPSRPRRGAAASRTPRSDFFLIFDLFLGRRADVFRDTFWVHLVQLGVYLGAEVLFIGHDRCPESYLLDATVGALLEKTILRFLFRLRFESATMWSPLGNKLRYRGCGNGIPGNRAPPPALAALPFTASAIPRLPP